jgi:hypothetical protein
VVEEEAPRGRKTAAAVNEANSITHQNLATVGGRSVCCVVPSDGKIGRGKYYANERKIDKEKKNQKTSSASLP